MFGIGMPELIIICAIIFVVSGMGLGRRGGSIRAGGPTLVLKKFSVSESSQDGVFIEIVGRASGFMAWLLTVLGFDAETQLNVTENDFSFKSSSLFGQIVQTAPLLNISSTHCGYSKPIGFLIIGCIFIIGGIISSMGRYGSSGAFIAGLIIGGIFLLLYWLSKKMTLSFETNGGMIMGLTFKRSVIENVAVDIEKARQAIEVINKNIIKSQSKI
jgi:hypothetical protein